MQGNGVQLDKKQWYEHVPKSVGISQEGKVIILWNQQVQTDRTIPNNKPDIMIRDNEKGTCMLIDVAISGDRNVECKSKSDTISNRGDWDYFKVIRKIRELNSRKT